MRKIALLLCVLCLIPILALAEDYVSLSELREQVGEGWHKSFTAKGREVAVQADINWFPEVDTCPVLEVAGAATAQPGAEFRKSGKVLKSDIYVNWAWMQESPFLDRSEGDSCSPVHYTVYDGEVPTLIPDELDISYDELLAQVDTDIAPYTDVRLADFRIEEVKVEGIRYVLEDTLPDGTPVLGNPRSKTGAYRIGAVQLLHGIPFIESRETHSSKMPGGSFSYYYFSQDWRYYHLYCAREISVIQPDVPLLSFEAMKRVWIKQIEAGKLRGIDELEFGYLVCKSGKQFFAIPVWRLKGGYTTDPNKKNVMPYHNARDKDGSLTVPTTYTDYYYNAQTGEMMPVQKNEAHTLKNLIVLTWEDVQ